MITLFNEYKDAGKINEALLIGRNMVNKNPESFELVQAYLELLLSLAQKLPSLDERKGFVGQANITLAFFEENAELTSELIGTISDYKGRVNNIAKNIDEEERDRSTAILMEIQTNNGKQIKTLYSIKQKLVKTKTQEEFDATLIEINRVDEKIEHDYMTEEQKVHYDQLNRECTETISVKMRELEHISNVKYNNKAVEAYDSAFRKFINDESKYKNQTQLFSLVSSTLFAFDAARLFNETLIFYNHVYSYIFGKLDDDGRFALTRYSIECERKLR